MDHSYVADERTWAFVVAVLIIIMAILIDRDNNGPLD